MSELITIEVAYATAEKQVIINLTIEKGATISDAIHASEIIKQFPILDLPTITVGIFSTVYSVDYIVQDGDRVELYRPLMNNPKEMRRQRAELTAVHSKKKKR